MLKNQYKAIEVPPKPIFQMPLEQMLLSWRVRMRKEEADKAVI